jgi:Response regulators consisting of a CheY-like receiver domain and a winged-helix DNA-binding domain
MKTVLIIEDNQEIRENTSEILELRGLKVITSDNGNAGIAMAINRRPDIILCDIMMPGLDGYEVIKQLKGNPITAPIPFIYITASGEKSEVKMAIELGASGYIRKPFDVKELTQAIDKFLRL